MGSRVRIAAAACLVASWLFAAGAGATIAFAEPGHHHGDSGDNDSNDSGGTTIREGLGHDHDGSGQAPNNDVTPSETRPGVNGTTPGVGPLPGGTGNEHSGNVGTGKTPAEHKPGDNKPDERNQDDQDGDESGGGATTPSTPPSSTSTEQTPPPEEPGCDEDKNDDHCNPGLPGWPWWPWERLGQPPGPGGGGGGGGGAVELPSGRPQSPPQMQLPSEPPASEPAEPGVVSPVPGVGISAELPLAPLTLPVIVAPSVGMGGGGAGPGGPNTPTLPGTPRGVTAEPPAGREPLPANAGSNNPVLASSYRIGYGEYLRSAGLSQVAALAVPGVTGILVLTGAGGLVGYRQAKAGHAVRTGGTARFIN